MQRSRRTWIEPLEARLLLSADAALGILAPDGAAVAVAHEPALSSPEADAVVAQSLRSALVLVDAGVEGYEPLVRTLREAGGERLRVEVLSGDRDGLAQIDEILRAAAARGERFDAVHVVSHGTDAALRLGDGWLTRETLAGRAGAIASWGDALTGDADLLLYGCGLAASDEGRALVSELALLTGADVAASRDATGAARLGGDWELEHATGAVEAASLDAAARDRLDGLLDGTAIWVDQGSDAPESAPFDGSAWGPAAPAPDVMGEWRVVAGAEAPTRDEKIVVGLTDSGDVTGMMWNGSAWSAFPMNPLATNLSKEKWSLDVAYESQSGDALVVHADKTNLLGGISYRVWDGTSWSARTALTSALVGEVERVRLASNPLTDEIVLVATTKAKVDMALVWNGSAWGNPLLLASGAVSADSTDASVAYEQQSGHAMVVYGGAGTPAQTAIWNGSAWSASGAVAAPAGVSGGVRWTSLASDPNSDRIALGVISQNRYVWLAVWDGSAWQASVLASTDSPHNDRLEVGVAFESASGEAVAAYATGADTLKFRTWAPGTGWSSERTGPDLGQHLDGLTLSSDPASDRLMLSVLGQDKSVAFLAWDGAAWSAPVIQETDSGTDKGQPFVFLWDRDDLNDAPVLTPSAPVLPALTEDDAAPPGQLVATLLGISVTDADPGALAGIAVTGLASGNGAWEFSTDGGASWAAMGPVSATSARLLRDVDRVRFVPDGANGTTASFDFRAWDQTTGSAGALADASQAGGSTAFSAASDTASVVVSSVNDAPVLDASAVLRLPNVIENDSAPSGSSVAALLLSAGGDRIADVDLGALDGIAVVGVDDTNGVWQYSTDGGGSWSAFGAVSNASALLLGAADRIRFVPAPAYAGPVGDLTFRAWDRSSGTRGDTGVDASTGGGTTAFSVASGTATLDVIPVNDAPDLVPAAPVLAPIGEDDTANPGQTVASFLGASVTDLDAGALSGIAVTGLAPGRGAWQYSLDGGASWTDVGTVSDAEALLLRDSDRVRFVPDGVDADAASLTYRAWDRTTGAAGTKVEVSVTGGATAFSAAVDTATIAVGAVNDAPVLAPGGPLALTPVPEDAAAPPGDDVATILAAAGVLDVDPGALTGIAVIGADETHGAWEYSTDGGASWVALGPVSDAAARLLAAGDRLRFVPAPSYVGPSGALQFRAWDQTSGAAGAVADTAGGGGTSAFSATARSASLEVTPENDAPVLTPAAPALPAITEDDVANGGVAVSTLLTGSTDVDAGALSGIAVTGLASGNGVWEHSLDGGVTWLAIGAVSDANALLLRDSDLVRFVPDGRNADAVSLAFRAWDQSAGSAGATADTAGGGGTSAFSAATDTATLNVTAVNDAPVLTPAAPALPSITEDDVANGGVAVSALVAGSVADVDAGALTGIAVTGLASGNGVWEHSLDGGATWTAIGAVSDANALLLRDSDLVRFVPDGANADAASLTFRGWDRTSGAAGAFADASIQGGTSAFSAVTDTAPVSVTSVNDAPVLTPAAPALPAITEDDVANGGVAVSALLAGSVADVDAGAVTGIAVTGLASGNGVWEHSLDGGATWTAIGAVSDANALLLRDSDLVRFVPDGANADAASLTFRAWDRTSGAAGSLVDATLHGGTSAFSAATDTATLSVTAVNDAPVLAPGPSVALVMTEDDVTSPGTTVGALLGGALTDVDAGALRGIAITGLASGNGVWQASLDGGTSWFAIGAVSDASALLLRDSDLVRFVPDGVGADAASLTFRGWDRTTGAAGTTADASVQGGVTAFSTAVSSVVVSVTAANDAPVLMPAAPALPSITEDDLAPPGTTIGALLGGALTDVDAGALTGVAVTGLASGSGVWEHSLDGGATWTAIGAVSDANALLLRDSDLVRFVPDGRNADAASLTFRGWDRTSGTAGALVNTGGGGGTSAFSAASDVATLAVTAVNDAPVLTPAAPALPAITEDDVANGGVAVSALLAGSVADVDAGALSGIAVTGLASGNGVWEHSLDGGATWTAVGAVSDASALLLRDSDLVRFVPDGAGADAGSLTFRAWDRTSGAAGALVDATVHGGTSAFSAATDTATVSVTAVNDAPVLTPAAPALPSITEDDVANGGVAVSSLIPGTVADVDAGALRGIAVTGLSSGNGAWEHSLDGGATWTAIGAVSDASALLLRDSDRVRFVPDGRNADAASLTFRAWDRTSGAAGALVDATAHGGASAISAAADTATLSVTAVNDAPALGAAVLPGVRADAAAPAGTSLGSLFGAVFSDVDAGATLAGVAVVGDVAQAALGRWEYSSDGGVTWFPVGSVSAASALALDASTQIRFLPAPGAAALVAAPAAPGDLLVRALDDAYAGGFSSAAGGVEVRVQIDTGANGGSTPIGAASASLGVTLTVAPPAAETPPLVIELPPPVPVEAAPAPAPEGDAPPTPPLELYTPEEAFVPVSAALRERDAGYGRSFAPGGVERAPAPAGDEGTPAPVTEERRDPARTESPAAAMLSRSVAALEQLAPGSAFAEELDRLRNEAGADVLLAQAIAGSSIALSAGLSAGYVLWLTRGGLLLASLTSSMPAWRLIDPIPVLASLGRGTDEEEDDGESLGSLVDGEPEPADPPEPERAGPRAEEPRDR